MSLQKKKTHVKKPSKNIVEDEVPTTDGTGDGGVWPNCKNGYSPDNINKTCVKDPL